MSAVFMLYACSSDDNSTSDQENPPVVEDPTELTPPGNETGEPEVPEPEQPSAGEETGTVVDSGPEEEGLPEDPIDPPAVTETAPATLVINPSNEVEIASTATTGELTLALSDAPQSPVSIAITSSDTSTGTVAPEQIEFTQDNWEQPQKITIASALPEPPTEDKTFFVKLGPSQSEDARFNNLKSEIQVTLQKKAYQVIPLESIKLTAESTDLLFWDEIKINSELIPENTTQTDLVWSLSDPKRATMSTIDNHSIQLTGNSKQAGTLTVTVKEKNGKSSSMDMTLKPYAPLKFSYSKVKKMRDLGVAGCFTKFETSDAENDLPENYDLESLKVINHDLFTKFVMPNMVVKKGEDGKNIYYGTRASVLAAARFLVLQFPYDIPYYKVTETSEGKSHYVWAYTDYYEKGSDVRILGLNLNKQMFGDYKSQKVLAKDAIPWGQKVKKLDNNICIESSKYATDGTKELPPNGLACSGFVTWAFRNGRFHLGDWYTTVFAKNGACKDKDGNILRNYHCLDYVSKKPNPNNSHDSLYSKLKLIDDKTDFVKVDKNLKYDDFKAGDILWHACYNIGSSSHYSGHVAMIVGKKKFSSQTYIYVGEAIGRNGNYLRYYTWEDFTTNSGWTMEKPESCEQKDWEAYIIKMDKVYNFKKKEAGEDLNTYQYTEYWMP